MKTFIFQTGHAKGLAKTEILSILPNSITDEVMDGFVVEIEESQIPDPIAFLNRMGGIVRITEVIHSGPAGMPLNFEEWVVSTINAIKKENKGAKIRYGLSMHPKSEKVLKKTLIGSKKNLKKTPGNVRFVNKGFQNLSSVQAWHEKLLAENAIELHLFKSDEKWYLSKTLAIQNFEAYSLRDYDRPSRSAKNGMFPPKLAQILINLSQASPETVIYDPFCGSGTVMQEAWLMNLASQGSDISEEMIADSQENLTWLKKEFDLQGNPPKVFPADATQLTSQEIPKEPFVIVTETWLGPMLTQTPTPLELPKIQREVEALYEAFFANLQKVCPGVTVVFTAPYHRDKNERHFLPKLPEILEKYSKILPLSDHERPSLFFERKDQFVSREIWRVQIKK
jgi:tRNA G10  N-methylase Trm11